MIILFFEKSVIVKFSNFKIEGALTKLSNFFVLQKLQILFINENLMIHYFKKETNYYKISIMYLKLYHVS